MDSYDYITKAEKQFKDENVYTNVKFTKKTLQDLAETSNKMFQRLKTKGKIENWKNNFSILHMNTKRPVI